MYDTRKSGEGLQHDKMIKIDLAENVERLAADFDAYLLQHAGGPMDTLDWKAFGKALKDWMVLRSAIMEQKQAALALALLAALATESTIPERGGGNGQA